MQINKDLSQDSDFQLFKNDPGRFLDQNRSLIYYFIFLFLKSGKYKVEEEEIFHHVVDVILSKKAPIIIKNYKIEYSFVTYFSNAVKNIVKDYLRKEKKSNLFSLDLTLIKKALYGRTEGHLVIDEEINRLNFILKLYSNESRKILLCLKAYFLINFERDDFNEDSLSQFVDSQRLSLNQLIDALQNPASRQHCFENLTHIINLLYSADYKPDSLRRWTERKIDEILNLLNYDKNGKQIHFYEKETFLILLEKYFSNLSKMGF